MPLSTVDGNDKTVSVIYDIIRGKRWWDELNYFGFYVSRTPEGWIFHIPPEVSVPVEIHQIIEGAERLQHRPDRLQEWAQFVLLSGIWEFSRDTKEEDADELLEALWDFSFGDFESGHKRMRFLKNRISHQN